MKQIDAKESLQYTLLTGIVERKIVERCRYSRAKNKPVFAVANGNMPMHTPNIFNISTTLTHNNASQSRYSQEGMFWLSLQTAMAKAEG